MKKVFDSSRGQIAVLYAGILFVLVGAIALGTDVAVMYMNWQQVQKAADAAALAGANFLAETGLAFTGTAAAGCSGDDAKKAACTYAVDNGLAVASLNPPITEPTASTVKVSATETSLPYYFGRVVGLSTYAVSASATAAVYPVGSSYVFPLGLQCTAPCPPSSLTEIQGQPLTFGSKFVGGISPGNWQWLDVTGGSGGGIPSVENAILGTNNGVLFSVGGTIPSQNGAPAGSNPNVATDFAKRMGSCPTPTTDPCTPGPNPNAMADIPDPSTNPCLVVMPIVDFGTCTGKCSGDVIEGFANVYIEPTSTPSLINGCYVSGFNSKGVGGPTAQNYGSLAPPVLTQ